MKKFRILFAIVAMVVGTQTGMADVANEGEVDVRVELMNGKDFPGFEFYIKYQSYRYDEGYQPDGVSDVELIPGENVSTGSRGDQSPLYARDAQGNEYVSKDQIGGVATDFDPDVSYYLDQIEVVGVKNGEVLYKVVARKKMNAEGKVIEVVKGDVAGGGKSRLILILIPSICLAGLLAFFILRRRTAAK